MDDELTTSDSTTFGLVIGRGTAYLDRKLKYGAWTAMAFLTVHDMRALADLLNSAAEKAEQKRTQ